jgi:uncharacterized protein YaaR (DUF327 family)
MKIEKIGDAPLAPEPPPEPVQAPVTPAFSSALSERIQRVQDEKLRSELAGLIQGVDDRARRLLASKNKKDFEQYKESVKQFMEKAISGSYRLEEKHGQRQDGKFVVFLTMKRVDEALENLAQLIMAGQQDSMRMVARLDEIRGLLMDMYL